MVVLRTRQAPHFVGLIAAKDFPILAHFPRNRERASKWTKTAESLAEIMDLKEGPANWRRIVHNFCRISAGLWSICRLARRPTSWA